MVKVSMISIYYLDEIKSAVLKIAGKDKRKNVKEIEEKMAKRPFELPALEIGDTILIGKWKNRRAIIKGFGKDENNQPIVKTDKGDISMFKFRIPKLME